MKDVEIGALGETKVYMKLEDLFRIANKEVQDFADEVCEDNSKLQYKLDLAVEALNEIVNRNDFSRYCDGSLLDAVIADYDIQVDGIPLIKIAQRALKLLYERE